MLDANLTAARERLGGGAALPASSRVPVGAGFITGHKSVGLFSETALPIVKKHAPAAVWLFAPEEHVKPHGAIIRALKGLDLPPAVFVQVGNVPSAREAAQDGADVIVCQGIDAGGHQFRRGMGVVSLVPSVKAMLREEFPERDIVLIGAGGIVNGDGVAAVMALGECARCVHRGVATDFLKALWVQLWERGYVLVMLMETEPLQCSC